MRTIFPTTYSTLSPAALASWVGEQFGLIQPQCRLLVRGVGDTYQIEAQQAKFILRVYRPSHRTRAQIAAEVELLLAAKEAGVSVSYPVADNTGQYIHIFNAAEGERHAVLFSFASGAPVSILNKAQLQNLGHQLARFHNVSSTITLSDSRWSFDPATTLISPLEAMRPYFADLPGEYAWWKQAADRTIAHFDQTDTTNFSTGYCHFDLLPKNFHFEDDSLTLFDFDFFGHGWLINDFMTFRVHLDLDIHFNRLTREAADNAFDTFLATYKQERSLSDAEVALIPWLGLGWWCFYMGFHATHDQFTPLVQPTQLKARTALIRQLCKPLLTLLLILISFQLFAQRYTGKIIDSCFILTNTKNDTLLKVQDWFHDWELKDVNRDGYKDLLLTRITKDGEQDLYLFSPKTKKFVHIEGFTDFPAWSKVPGTKYYYSYYSVGAGDYIWHSDLFFLKDTVAVAIGSIDANMSDKDGRIVIKKLRSGKETVLSSRPHNIIRRFSEKWDFMRNYWKNNHHRFL